MKRDHSVTAFVFVFVLTVLWATACGTSSPTGPSPSGTATVVNPGPHVLRPYSTTVVSRGETFVTDLDPSLLTPEHAATTAWTHVSYDILVLEQRSTFEYRVRFDASVGRTAVGFCGRACELDFVPMPVWFILEVR